MTSCVLIGAEFTLNSIDRSKGGGGGVRGTSPLELQILSISCCFWDILAKSCVVALPEVWRSQRREILDLLLNSTGVKRDHAILSIYTDTYSWYTPFGTKHTSKSAGFTLISFSTGYLGLHSMCRS